VPYKKEIPAISITKGLGQHGQRCQLPEYIVPLTGRPMSVQQLVEWVLARKTAVSGENLPQCHLVHHKSNMSLIGTEPGTLRWEAGDWQGPPSGTSPVHFVSVMFLQTSVNNLYRLTSNLANDDYLFYEGF
jgi:hypothetical protein